MPCALIQARSLMLDQQDRPVKRSFVHVDDLADAILLAIDHPAARRQTFNIRMDEPVDYGELGASLARSRGLPTACRRVCVSQNGRLGRGQA
jgi:nucleoside-diphosphate-sugar epimerase